MYEENRNKLRELKLYENVAFEFSDGWTNLIYNLGKDITELCELINCELPYIQQVKSKYGHLKFYYNTRNSIYPACVENAISGLVFKAENKSEHTCETCGKIGETRITNDGFVFTACKEHGNKSFSGEEWQQMKLFDRVGIDLESSEKLISLENIKENKDIDYSNFEEYISLLDKYYDKNGSVYIEKRDLKKYERQKIEIDLKNDNRVIALEIIKNNKDIDYNDFQNFMILKTMVVDNDGNLYVYKIDFDVYLMQNKKILKDMLEI